MCASCRRVTAVFQAPVRLHPPSHHRLDGATLLRLYIELIAMRAEIDPILIRFAMRSLNLFSLWPRCRPGTTAWRSG